MIYMKMLLYPIFRSVKQTERIGFIFVRWSSQGFTTQTETKTGARTYRIVRPGQVQAQRAVPNHIIRPDYVSSKRLLDKLRSFKPRNSVEIKSSTQIDGMYDACHLARKVLNAVGAKVRPGVTTDELDVFAHELCLENNAYPSPLLYKGFPKSVCTSVNNVACHGIPDDQPLVNGDIINIDITVFYKGYHGDVSETFLVGDVDERGRHLVNVAKICRNKAIAECHPGQKYSIIGKTISEVAEEMGFQVIPLFCGHGIGSYFHGPPEILHYDNDSEEVMKEGTTFTIEPVICDGDPEVDILEDGWTAVSVDNSRSAQFEHTILITKTGHEILTL